MRHGWFITGTDTGIGKTLVTAGLLRALVKRGIPALPLKPVQSGCIERNGRRIATDLAYSLQAAGLTLTDEEQDSLCPNKFLAACSPHLAADMEGTSIDWDALLALPHHDHFKDSTLLIEGAGGLYVPIDRQHIMLDLIEAYTVPVILVARAGLGTINHTMLSVQALRSRSLPIAAIVLNDTSGDTDNLVVQDNVKTLKELAGLPVLGPIPYLPTLDTETPGLEFDFSAGDKIMQTLVDLIS